VANTSKLVVNINGQLFGGHWDILIDDFGPIDNKFGQEVMNNNLTSSLTNTTPGNYRLTF
jgi:hypothetical protein